MPVGMGKRKQTSWLSLGKGDPHSGDPTLVKAPCGIVEIPMPDKSMPPPTALLQFPSRTRGAPAHAPSLSQVRVHDYCCSHSVAVPGNAMDQMQH